VLFDVIRAVKLALDRRVGGVLTSVSAYAFKHPLESTALDTAEQWFNQFVLGKRER